LVEATFEAWATLSYNQAITKAAFRAWSNPPWELNWDLIETGAAEVDYRQRLTKTAFEEWVLADKKPLKLTPAQIVQLGFTPLVLDRMDFRQWNQDEWPLPRLPDRSGGAVG
jgi:hypothetical protein